MKNPINGQTVSGQVTLEAVAADDRDITGVSFLVGTTNIPGQDSGGDGVWSAPWDTTSYTAETAVTIRYLAGVARSSKDQSSKKSADEQAEAVDLPMAYGL